MGSATALRSIPVDLAGFYRNGGRRRPGEMEALELASRSKVGVFGGSCCNKLEASSSFHSLISCNALCKFSQHIRTTSFVPSAFNVTAGQSDGPGKLDMDGMISALRRLWDGFPRPVKSFPWTRALTSFCEIILQLAWAVAKFLCIPLLAVSSLSEMSYCAHERKMVVIPIPFLVGLAVAGTLKDAAMELSPALKQGERPWHLLLIASFFALLKLLGPYYPYWGRLVIPHFANGGLWRIIWAALTWYRLSRGTPGMVSAEFVAENPPDAK